MNKIRIRNIINENDYSIMCHLESNICKTHLFDFYQMHIGGLSFDRYMFGNGMKDIYSYGNLIYFDEQPIGYLLAYTTDGILDGEFIFRILPDYGKYLDEVLKEIEIVYKNCKEYFTISNNKDEHLCKSLINHGFKRETVVRFQATLNLNNWESKDCKWITESIETLKEDDTKDRVRYASIPTGQNISEQMFEDYMQSKESKDTLDYVVRDISTNDFVGFVTWWTDPKSKTALLEPVACRKEYRKRGIMKRTLIYGLHKLKKRGVQCVYVSTSIDNKPAQSLFQSVGFIQNGEVHKYIKQK